MEVFPGVSMDPGVRFGKPCLTGTRIDVATVVGALAAGESFEAIEQDYDLTHEQVLAALHVLLRQVAPRRQARVLSDRARLR